MKHLHHRFSSIAETGSWKRRKKEGRGKEPRICTIARAGSTIELPLELNMNHCSRRVEILQFTYTVKVDKFAHIMPCSSDMSALSIHLAAADWRAMHPWNWWNLLEANQPNQRNKTRIRTEFEGWKTFKTLEDLSDFWISSWEQWRCKKQLAGVFCKHFFMFIPIWGRFPILTNIFQMGWCPTRINNGVFKHISEKTGTNVVIAYPCHAYDCGCSPWAAPFLRVKTLRLGCWIWGAMMPGNARKGC